MGKVNLEKDKILNTLDIVKRPDGKYCITNNSSSTFELFSIWNKAKVNKKFISKLNSSYATTDDRFIGGIFRIKAGKKRVLNKKNFKSFIKRAKLEYKVSGDKNIMTVTGF
ncbi:MAG: hypothetical protein J6A59_01670 [Lachnospiraceae bacterium]|nr:hypothetical protein [Lachnospiraceae bacterium]